MLEKKPNCLSLKEVTKRLGVCPKTIYNWVKQGRFPQPISCSPRKLLWLESDVEEVLARRRIKD